ncbi:MAG TPA: asparagine synthase (glutamine-hydrolyzing) [Chitinophagaceae bacterium]|nr:asparagine synthase (glutamine-hydrolyzing) [Chitinophagaceae bacterium]
MCRITGIIDFRYKAQNNEIIIDEMRDSMIYGGPDDCGSYLCEMSNCSIALGHRRLSVIDVSINGHQPMRSADENVVIVYNGEMYNYEEVKTQLEHAGVHFKTQSDTEVIIEAYNKWGINCINKFIGMFAFLLLDKKQNFLYVVRDRAGVKPLYYYKNDELILFGSELKGFHKHPRFQKKINTDALALYLQFGYIPAPHCIFQNTFKILPGHCLKVNLKNGDIEDNIYWNAIDAYKQPLTNEPVPQLIQKTEDLLVSACNYRMVADVPVGVFLSGGYDSSLVAALLQKDRTEKIKTFSIGFNEEAFNEAPFAKRVSEHLGTDHTEYYCTHKDALEILPLLPHIYDEPFGDSSAIPTTLVSRLARQSVKVALSADGGDEVFGGYEKYSSIIGFKEKIKPIPPFLQKFAGVFSNAVNPSQLLASSPENTFNKKVTKLSEILQSKNMAEILYWYSINFTQKQLENILQKPFSNPATNFNLSSVFSKKNDDINTMLAIDYITYLPDDILTKVDRATMSVSLEGREPLLDHRLLEWMATIPGSTKIKGGIKKYLLKEIVHTYIPKSIMNRPKMGFGVPITIWFKKDLRDYFETYLGPASLQKHNIFNIEYIQKKKALYYSGKGYESLIAELWFLLMFQMWYERWMT